MQSFFVTVNVTLKSPQSLQLNYIYHYFYYFYYYYTNYSYLYLHYDIHHYYHTYLPTTNHRGTKNTTASLLESDRSKTAPDSAIHCVSLPSSQRALMGSRR